jgi:hypothetical protein
MSANPNPSEPYLKAGQENTRANELRRLAIHDHHLVRLRVAEHPNSPQDVLKILAKDQHPDVRAAVGEHPSAPAEILERLVADLSVDVRYVLAESPSIPGHLLQKLAADENPYVSVRAQRTLRSLTQGSSKSNNIGGNPQVNPKAISQA